MSARIRHGLRIACAIGLAASLVGACSSPNEERDLPACDGTTYVLESAIRYQLIEGFSPLRLTGIEADAAGDAPHATLTVSWSDGVNVPEGMYQTLTVGQSATLDNVGTFTLIDVLPPSGERHWSTPVVCFQQDPQLIDTARTYAADNGLLFPGDEQDSQS